LLFAATALDAWSDKGQLPPNAFEVGFWRQVFRAPFSASDWLSCAMLSLAPALVFLRAFHLTKLSSFVLHLCEGALSYLVLCAGHRMSELMLMLLVMTELATLKRNIKIWATIYIKAEATFKVARLEAEVDKWELDQDMKIAALPEAFNASGLAVGMRICSVDGVLVRNVAQADSALVQAFKREVECEHVDVIASGRPLSVVGAEAAFQELRSQGKEQAQRLSMIIHYLLLERVMYFLTEFAQERSIFTIVFRHLVYTVVGSFVLLSISELNFVGTRYLEGLIADAELSPALDPSLRARLKFRWDPLEVNVHWACLRVLMPNTACPSFSDVLPNRWFTLQFTACLEA